MVTAFSSTFRMVSMSFICSVVKEALLKQRRNTAMTGSSQKKA